MKNLKIIITLILFVFMASCSKSDEPAPALVPTASITVTNITPTSGPKNTSVILTGENFSSVATNNIVTINDKPCIVNTASTTSLSITIPRGAGSGVIKVSVSGLTAQSTNFEYVITPSVVSTFAGSTQGYADGLAGLSQFSFPSGVAVDAQNNIYVADYSNHKIRKISPSGEVTTLVGSTLGYADGQGTAAKFNGPFGIALDASGNFYVADSENQKIRKISTTGAVTTLAGSTYGFADGTGSNAQFKFPLGVAVDLSNNVYVADLDNYKIRKISPTGVVTTLAGSTFGFADGTGAAAAFGGLFGIDVDISGNIFVPDNGDSKIRKISPAGVVTTLAGSTAGFADGTAALSQFNYPEDVAVDAAGNIYVADTSNHKIRKINTAGIVSTVAGSTQGLVNGTANTAKFSNPRSIAIDGQGNLYVADRSNHVIRKITID